jgi:hypothetical protein
MKEIFKTINLKGEVTLFRQKYSEYQNTCIIKGMVEIYDIMNFTCQNLYHMSYQHSPYITPRAGGPWGDINILGIRYRVCDIEYKRYRLGTIIDNAYTKHTIFESKYIKGMVEIYDIMNITCQNLYHMPYQPSTYITPRAGGPWGDIRFSG